MAREEQLEKRSSRNNSEHKPKAKLEMDQSLIAREHQEAQDKLEMDEARDELEMDDEQDTSDICRMCQR
jgi:hypothetical protein